MLLELELFQRVLISHQSVIETKMYFNVLQRLHKNNLKNIFVFLQISNQSNKINTLKFYVFVYLLVFQPLKPIFISIFVVQSFFSIVPQNRRVSAANPLDGTDKLPTNPDVKAKRLKLPPEQQQTVRHRHQQRLSFSSTPR